MVEFGAGEGQTQVCEVNRREQNRGRETREEDKGPGLEWEGGRCSSGGRLRTLEMCGSGWVVGWQVQGGRCWNPFGLSS